MNCSNCIYENTDTCKDCTIKNNLFLEKACGYCINKNLKLYLDPCLSCFMNPELKKFILNPIFKNDKKIQIIRK